MAKPELGTKRLCENCGAKFYDLKRTPIVCPKCSTVFLLAPITRARPEVVAPTRAAVLVEETVIPETQAADFVSLEEADDEAQGKKPADGEAAEGDDEIEIAESPDDVAFIEEAEEGDDDVTDIIGGVGKDEDA